jgi:hypothetical protein
MFWIFGLVRELFVLGGSISWERNSDFEGVIGGVGSE